MRTNALIHPKVPAQALTTIVVFLLAHLGIELDADVSAAIATLIGFAAGYIAPAVPAFEDDPGPPSDQLLGEGVRPPE